MRYGDPNFTLNQEGIGYAGVCPKTSGIISPMVMYLYVDDVHEALHSAIKYGYKVMEDRKLEFYGDLKARILDPYEYVWDIATKQK